MAIHNSNTYFGSFYIKVLYQRMFEQILGVRLYIVFMMPREFMNLLRT